MVAQDGAGHGGRRYRGQARDGLRRLTAGMVQLSANGSAGLMHPVYQLFQVIPVSLFVQGKLRGQAAVLWFPVP